MKNKIASIKFFLFVFVAFTVSKISSAQTILNPGFESWFGGGCPVNVAPDDWTNFSEPVGLGPDQAGCNGPVVSFQDTSHMNLVWSNTGIREGCKQAVSGLTAGVIYHVNFYAIQDQGLWADTGSVILNFYQNSTIVFSTPELFFGGAWTLFTATFTALSTTDTIGFQVAPGTTSTSGSVGVDAVSFSSTENAQDLLDETEVKIYPNPFENQVAVSVQNKNEKSISIQNVLGETVYSVNEINFSIPLSIEMNEIPSGIYFLTLNGEGGVVTKKIVKL